MKNGSSLCALLCLWATAAMALDYQNPVLPYDYSDPDVCRVGSAYYMTASSFNCVPGLQILRSDDLVHWQVVDAALPDAVPGTETNTEPEFGRGVWAPSIRWHNNRLYVYYGDPDRGIYCVRTEEQPSEQLQFPLRWEKAVSVKAGKGMIDPCPLWDEDGRCYLVHAYAGSRAQLKSVLVVMELAEDGLSVLYDGRIVFDGHVADPTSEGPKLYKRDGYYYIFHPAGGVATGWQNVLRSRSVYGPYEYRTVLRQGNTPINGPHQGAWVETAEGEHWFLHFQDVGTAGRILHLQPMRWQEGWPVMGDEGEPVAGMRNGKIVRYGRVGKPLVHTRDEFNATDIGLEWQWTGNRSNKYYFADANNGVLRLFSFPADSIEVAPNVLLQKQPACAFRATAKLRFCPNRNLVVPLLPGETDSIRKAVEQTEQAGLILTGKQCHVLCAPEDVWTWLRVEADSKGIYRFYRSTDGEHYAQVGEPFSMEEGAWIGAKIGLFCTRKPVKINDSGYLEADWFEIESW